MPTGPTTRPSLLARVKDLRDRDSWSEFVDLYAPVVFGFARAHGLQDADAADLTQEVIQAIAGAITRFEYAPARGGFRAWLARVSANHLRTFFRRSAVLARVGGDSGSLDSVPAPPNDPDAVWEEHWQRQAFAAACEAVKGQVSTATWEAFHKTAILGTPGTDVARELGMTPAAVYLARGRVLARLRTEVERMQEE